MVSKVVVEWPASPTPMQVGQARFLLPQSFPPSKNHWVTSGVPSVIGEPFRKLYMTTPPPQMRTLVFIFKNIEKLVVISALILVILNIPLLIYLFLKQHLNKSLVTFLNNIIEL